MSNIMEQVVIVTVKDNPKKPGTASRTRFSSYRTGQTRLQALAAGVKGIDLRWDTKHGYIKLVSAKQYKEYQAKNSRKAAKVAVPTTTPEVEASTVPTNLAALSK